MKNNIDKILSSSLFFHISVLLLYILIFALFFVFSMFRPVLILLTTLFFSGLYPSFVIVMAIVIKNAYINIHQAPVSEEFVNKLVFYNRLLITVIYVFSLIAGFFEGENLEGALIYLFLLFVLGLCFLFYLFVLPTTIRRLMVFKKASFKPEGVILGIFLLFFLVVLYILVRYTLIEIYFKL